MTNYKCHHCGHEVKKAHFPAKDFDYYTIDEKMYCLKCIKAIAKYLVDECQTLYG